jgi:tetratricopeptide (TPR) repeat protein
MANYYEVVGDKEAAETQIRSALVNEKLDVETKVGILSRYVIRLRQTEKGMDSANALFQTLLEQHPEDIDLKQMYGSLLVAQDKNDEARFQFQLITEMEPTSVGAWQQLLNLALKSEDIPEVIRICTRCQELFPDAPEYYFYLGVAYFQQDKYQEALDTYKAGLEIIPENNLGLKSDFYGQIGDIYYQLKNLPETYKAYDEALKYNDKNVVILNNYAYFLSLEKKDLKKAERMSAQTVKLEPNNATYLDTYAWIFFVQGNYTLAKIYIESALANDTTKSAELVDHYGDILYMKGDKEKALEQWKKAKELGKESKVLDRKIAEGVYIEEGIQYEF